MWKNCLYQKGLLLDVSFKFQHAFFFFPCLAFSSWLAFLHQILSRALFKSLHLEDEILALKFIFFSFCPPLDLPELARWEQAVEAILKITVRFGIEGIARLYSLILQSSLLLLSLYRPEALYLKIRL